MTHSMLILLCFEMSAPPEPAASGASPGWPALNRAARLAISASARRLLAAGAKPDSKDSDGQTPLHHAALETNRAMAELLLKYKADPNARTPYGETPLHIAARFGHKGPAETLLAHMADVNARDKEGITPIYLAASERHRDLVKLLAAKGAELDPVSAISLGRNDVLAALLDKDPKRRLTYRAYGLLDWAAQCGNKGTVELLLKRGANIHDGDKVRDGTALHRAAAYGHTAVAELLLQRGASWRPGTTISVRLCTWPPGLVTRPWWNCCSGTRRPLMPVPAKGRH